MRLSSDPKAVEGAPKAGDGVDVGGVPPPPAPSAMPHSPVNNRPNRPSNEARAREAEEDRKLVASAQKGDMTSFHQLVVRHQRRAFVVARSMVRDDDDAREIVQDAFLRAYKALPGFAGDSSFDTWFYRIVRNLAVDLRRKPGRDTVEYDDERSPVGDGELDGTAFLGPTVASPAESVRRREMADQLRAALDALPPQHREIIVLREVEGASYEDLASILGISQGTVMSRLFYARQKLQAALGEFYRQEVDGASPPRDGARRTKRGGA